MFNPDEKHITTYFRKKINIENRMITAGQVP